MSRTSPVVHLALLTAVVAFALAPSPSLAQHRQPPPGAESSALKSALCDSIRQRADASWRAALQIWSWAEPGYQEKRSAALLAEMLQQSGFEVERGVAGIPTAFVATLGEGRPIIGLLGEYDALPGLSQTANPVRQPRADASYGHGCGHHLFGVASASAAIALAEQIKAGALRGTVRFYGCPAEEGGAAKVFMTREGLFNDCDAVLHWHPGSTNAAGDSSNLSRIAAKFRFYGTSAHASGSPEQGRSALDAVELTNFAAQLLREHTPESTRIHYVITAGGDAPNVVPEFAEVYYYVRHPKSATVRELYRRLELCAQAGALATETRLEIDYLGGTLELLPNDTLAQVTLQNLTVLNDLKYSPDEIAFATRLQATMPEPKPLESIQEVTHRRGNVTKGSTDVGDVSWVVPTTGFSTACWVPGTPGHSWQAVACGGTTIARQGMDLAARVLAATACDLYTQPDLLAKARAEHQQRLATQKYEPLLTPGQKPPLDYRDTPKDRRTRPAE
jgi:aminobenzoyl-glutamate utilization protein B